MKNVYIYGCGGFGKEVLQIIRDLASEKNEIHCKGFIVDPGLKPNDNIQGIPVYESLDHVSDNDEIVIAIGSPSVRLKIYNFIKRNRPNIVFSTLVHPKAWVGHNVYIGSGCIICAGALITTDIRIGNQVHINIGCTIGHDSDIGEFTTLNPAVSVSGNAIIGKGCEIGTKSTILPNIVIGDWSISGAGCVVTQNLPGNITAVGVPAKIIKQHPMNWHIV